MQKASDLSLKLAIWPDLPVVCEVDSDVSCCDGEFGWYLAEDVSVRHDWLLDRNDETIAIVGDECTVFKLDGGAEDNIRYYLEDDERTENMTDDEFDALVAEELEKLEPYWIECVVLEVKP